MKGLAIAYLCLGCVVLGALVSSAEPAESVEAAAPVVINGDPVSAEEFEWFMQLERATVIDHVKTEFNLDYGDAFWSRECGETTPKGMLQARVLDRVRRDKVQQGLFRDLGLISDTSYAAFLENLEKVNREREEAVAKGRVVYGPIRYSQLQYYGHWMATLQIRAKEKMAGERFGITEQAIRVFYEENKNRLFKNGEKWTLEVLTASLRSSAKATSDTRAAETVVRDVFAEMQSGEPIDKVMSAYDDKSGVQLSHAGLNAIDADRLSECFPDRTAYERIRELQAGQCLELPVDEGTVKIIRCASRTPERFPEYTVVRDRVRGQYLDELYSRHIDGLMENATVKIDRESLSRIEPQ